MPSHFFQTPEQRQRSFEAAGIPIAPTQPIRDIQFGQGVDNVGAVLSRTGDLASQISSTAPQDLSSQVLNLLQQYQQFGRRTQREAEIESAQRLQQTPEELIGAAPSVQTAVRTAAVGAVEPTIGGAKQVLQQAQDLITQFQNQTLKNQQQAQTLVTAAIGVGSEALQGLIETQPELLKTAGIDPKAASFFVSSLKQTEAKEVKTESFKMDDGTIITVDTRTGQEVGRVGGVPSGQLSSEQQTTLGLVNQIIASPELEHVSGKSRFLLSARLAGITGSVRNQLKQLRSLTALENRSLLKGTLSDRDLTILVSSANSLNASIDEEKGIIALSDKEAKRHLNNIRGNILTATGRKADVIATFPSGRQQKFRNQSQQDINTALLQGISIDYLTL